MSAIFRRLAIAASILLSADACLAAEEVPGYQEIPKWQVACAGEAVTIDVKKNRPVDQVIFEIKVSSRKEPPRENGKHDSS